MSELIESAGNEKGNVVRIGEENTPIPMKVYQDIYHQVTGKTEKIKKIYTENLLIDFSELEQLHFKIMQLCDVHNVVANSEVINVFHDQERSEQYTSFERFRKYNSNSAKPVVSVVIKYNFSILPNGIKKPQEYVIVIKLSSKIAMIEDLEESAPPFIRGAFFSFMAREVAEISVDYVDYVIARGFMEGFDEWVKGCKCKPKLPWLDFLQKYSYTFQSILLFLLPAIFLMFTFNSVPETTKNYSSNLEWAQLVILVGGSFYFLVILSKALGKALEQSVDSYFQISYLNLNKGDSRLIEQFYSKRRKLIYRFIGSACITIVLGVVSSKVSLFF